MAVVNLVKSIYTLTDVTALGEIASGDTVDIPTGSTATNLGLTTPSITGGTASSLGLTTPSITGGTATNLGLTTPTITGGTATNTALTTPTVTNPTVTNYVETLYSANTGTAITVDLANGTVQKLTLTGNATITMPTATAGKSFVIMLKQDATGSRSVTWSTVVWPAGTAPTITGTANKMDMYSFFSDGTSWYGVTVSQNY